MPLSMILSGRFPISTPCSLFLSLGAYFRRIYLLMIYFPGIYSSSSVTSLPIHTIPLRSPSGLMTISSTGRWSGSVARPGCEEDCFFRVYSIFCPKASCCCSCCPDVVSKGRDNWSLLPSNRSLFCSKAILLSFSIRDSSCDSYTSFSRMTRSRSSIAFSRSIIRAMSCCFERCSIPLSMA
ncbi:hypothetical protein B879_04178 [Cecembia lonarensis LW9]|uniref:Uncharacterized protein n=1 Tax=Cecembia lonarensis (strain CCUG 58316 / KCTC 22772 / LW9) TaxID=1225176 RepID=K1L5C6_CECL9|nr:hypothetical protein B879_04178 [Cecembia lonarensis LW9]